MNPILLSWNPLRLQRDEKKHLEPSEQTHLHLTQKLIQGKQINWESAKNLKAHQESCHRASHSLKRILFLYFCRALARAKDLGMLSLVAMHCKVGLGICAWAASSNKKSQWRAHAQQHTRSSCKSPSVAHIYFYAQTQQWGRQGKQIPRVESMGWAVTMV